ncbi:7439_t:CDS:2 [Diversispora eburnea]|uniref:7439_t:CDS:1 n=1 Tax=Diversispora eburnea TaxID=1213867 RepID=A0A9N9FSG2_9GLOM|nr:7439_t:CDS:2 [Diversispora eburnea]
MKNFYNDINPYIDLCSSFQKNNGIWFSKEFYKHITVGKEIRKRKFDNFSSDKVLVQHYLQLGRNLERLLPCDQCPLNTHNNKKDNRCLVLMKRDEILQIPVKRSKVSTSQLLPNKNKPRIKMPLSDIVKTYRIINETSDTINRNKMEKDSQVLSSQSEVPDHQRLDMTIKEKFLNKWFITTDVIIKKLLRVAEEISHVKSYSVYIDDSKQDFQGCNIMGLGWIIPTSDIITKILRNKEKIYDNNIILSAAAQQIIHELKTKICLKKVEAHADIEYNEMADHLAQVSSIAPFKDPRISINSHSLNHLKVIPTWNDLTLEFSIKTMTKKLSSEIWNQKWLQQNRTRLWIHTNKAKNINWELPWKTVHQTKISSLFSSFEKAAMRKFSLKLINNELPRLDNLHKRNPLLYTSNTCNFCQIEIKK